MSVSAMNAATIGGASVGLYGCLSLTELDSHANMPVLGETVQLFQEVVTMPL